jgi:hypothetical protein
LLSAAANREAVEVPLLLHMLHTLAVEGEAAATPPALWT